MTENFSLKALVGLSDVVSHYQALHDGRLED